MAENFRTAQANTRPDYNPNVPAENRDVTSIHPLFANPVAGEPLSSHCFANQERCLGQPNEQQQHHNSADDAAREMKLAIENRINEQIKRGDFVPPYGDAASPKKKSEQLTKGLIDSEMFSNSRFGTGSENMYFDPKKSGQGDYPEKAKEATKDVDKKEQEIAKKMWDALDPKTKSEIMKEQWGNIYVPASERKTPFTDKFKQDLADKIAPHEVEREHIQRQLFRDLPESQRRQIYMNMMTGSNEVRPRDAVDGYRPL